MPLAIGDGPSLKTIGVREFLRGAYKDLTEPTLIMSHSRPLGIWSPSEDNYSFSVSGSSVYGKPRAFWSGGTTGTFTTSSNLSNSGILSGSYLYEDEEK